MMIVMKEASDSITITLEQLQAYCDQMGNNGLYRFDDHSWTLFGGGAVSAVLFMILMVVLAFLFYKRENLLSFFDRNLTYFFIFVWALGFAVYDLGMYPDHCENGANAFWALLGVAPMAVIHAFGMFILLSDVSAIHEACHNSALFMFFFSMAHLLAAFISMVFVIKHFGFNIVANFIRIIKTHFFVKNKENLYVFWGMNDATYYLAKDIITPNPKDKSKEKDPRILIVRVNNTKEDPNKPIGMDRLFSFLSLSNNNLDNLQELQKLGCLTCSTFGSLTDIQAANNNDLIRSELRLNSVLRLMRNTNSRVHMFFLDDDEAFNLQAVGNLKRDKSINEYVKNKKITFYCHARHDSIQRVIEDEPTHKNIEVHVVDSSHLSVEQLKLEENIHLQPVNYVDIEQDARVSSSFNALVVGFSEVGLDMVRFLYEFGAFVKHKKKKDTKEDAHKGEKEKEEEKVEKGVERSDFHCDVVDKNMSALAGLFIANTPAISPAPHLHLESEYIAKLDDDSDNLSIKERLKQIFNCSDPRPMIDLHEMDCRSVVFYKCLEHWLPDLNYIVLATGDDELNMANAAFIFRQAICYRKDLKHFRIMVRVRHDENGHFSQIAQYFNRLWKAEGARIKFHQATVSDTEVVDGPITLFGSCEKIYTYAHIVDEALKDKAKRYKAEYDQSLYDYRLAVYQSIPDSDDEEEQKEKEKLKPYPITTWDEEQNDFMQLNDAYKGFSPTYSGIMKLRRMQNQNLANSLHAETKVFLANKALSANERELMRKNGLTRDKNNKYHWKNGATDDIEHIQAVMSTLAQTEHLRWIASHEMLGYRLSPSTNEAQLLHNCICAWDKLENSVVRGFDYNTVDVSLTESDKF